MKASLVALVAVCIGMWGSAVRAAEPATPRVEAMRDAIQKRMAAVRDDVAALRKNVSDFYDARAAGDKAAAMKAAAAARDAWQSLPEKLRSRIEDKHPNTGSRVQNLKQEFDMEDGAPAPAAAAKTTPTPASEASKTLTGQSTTTRDGNTVQTSGSVTNAQGQTVRIYEGSTAKEGNTLEHQGAVTNGQGDVLRTNDTTITKTGPNSAERDTTITTAGGKTVTVDATKTRDGNTVETDKTVTVTNKDGQTKTAAYDGTATKDGNTVSREGTWTNADGKTIATTQGQATKDGNTVTAHNEVHNANGDTVRSRDTTATRDGNTVTRDSTLDARRGTRTFEGTATRDGNTVTRSGSVTATPKFTPRYSDEHDIFGGRPAARPRAGGRR
jgi:cytochrome c556